MKKRIYIFINQVPPRVSNANHTKLKQGAYEAIRLESQDVTVQIGDDNILLLKQEEREYWTELVVPK